VCEQVEILCAGWCWLVLVEENNSKDHLSVKMKQKEDFFIEKIKCLFLFVCSFN